MWKLNEILIKQVHIIYLYVIIVLFLLPLFLSVLKNPSMNTIIYRGGYSMVFAIIAYPIIWLLVLLLRFLVKSLNRVFRRFLSFLIFMSLLLLIIPVFLEVAYNFTFTNKEISYVVIYSSIYMFIGLVLNYNLFMKKEEKI